MTDENETRTSAADSEAPEAGVDEKAEATEEKSAGEAEGPTEGTGKGKSG